MPFSAVRVQLTIWNVAVLTFILLGCGLALHYRMHSVLIASVDWELKERASGFLRRPAPPTGPLSIRPGNAAGQPQTNIAGPFRMPPDFTGGPPTMPPDDAGGPPGPPPSDAGGPQGPPPNDAWAPRPHGNAPPKDNAPPGMPMRMGTDVRLLNLLGRVPFSNRKAFDTPAFQRSLRGEDVYITVTQDGDSWRIYSTPDVNRSGKIIGAVQSRQPLQRVDDEMASLDEVLLTLVPAGLIAAAIGAAFLSARALRPVHSVATAMERIQAADLSERLVVKGRDEFAVLATTFNSMLTRLQASFEQQRRFTSDASHELRTPIAVIKAKTSLCLSRPRSVSAYKEVVEAVDKKADEMTELVQNLLTLAQSDHGLSDKNRCRVLVNDIFSMALDQAGKTTSSTEGHAHSCPSIAVDVKDPDLDLECSPTELTRVVSNLITNACRHTPPEGSLRLTARRNAREIEIDIIDTGEGIPEEHIAHLGQRFYRVDTARNRSTGSTGLGLAICRSILEAHNGKMSIESTLGHGTTVHLYLPA